MNLATLIAKRAEEGRPIRVGMIGAGKFGTMFLAQAERQRGIPPRGYRGLYARMVTQAPEGCDFTFLQHESSARWTDFKEK